MTDIANVRVVKGLDDLVQQVTKTLVDRAAIESFRKKVTPLVTREITRAIELTKDEFNPRRVGGEEFVGQLGIGQGGQPDIDKMRNAWTLLIPGSSASKLSSSFAPSNLKKFGTFGFSIDIEKFYDRDLTNYTSTRSSPGNDGKRIPWMQNFIEGLAVQEPAAYIDSGDPNFNPKRSRTGIGHMIRIDRLNIPGRQFSFPGVGRAATFGKIQERVNRRFRTAKFRAELAAIFIEAIES